MAGNRTLKLSILADVDNLKKGLTQGTKDVETFGDKLGAVAKKAALALAAIGGAAIAASIDFAKAAAEDQQAANRLAQTLRVTTGATEQQIAAVERYITQTALATGVTDDQLRPSFERLARSVQDTEKSQTLLNLALDLSAATSAPLEQVTNALAKAYDGNFTALNRLGLGIDQNLIKAKDFEGIYRQLNSTFGEFSEARSEEAIVKFQRLQVAIQEAKEQIGAALLPIMERLGKWLLEVGVPNLQAFIDGFTGRRGLTIAITEANEGAFEFGDKIRKITQFVVKMKDELAVLGTVIASVFIASKIASFVTAVGTLVTAFKAWRTAAAGAAVATAAATGGVSAGAALTGIAAVVAGLAAAGIFLGGDSETGGGGGVNLGNRPFGRTGGGGAPTGGGTEDWISSTNGGGKKSLLEISGGLVTSPEDLVRKLTTTSERLSEIQFLIDTGQISKEKGRELLKQTTAEFRRLEDIGNAFQDQNTKPVAMGGQSRGENTNPTVVINVNSPSVIDEAGFGRAVVDALNSLERRQGGGASALQYL